MHAGDDRAVEGLVDVDDQPVAAFCGGDVIAPMFVCLEDEAARRKPWPPTGRAVRSPSSTLTSTTTRTSSQTSTPQDTFAYRPNASKNTPSVDQVGEFVDRRLQVPAVPDAHEGVERALAGRERFEQRAGLRRQADSFHEPRVDAPEPSFLGLGDVVARELAPNDRS